MDESTFVQMIWTGLIVFGFLGLLILPAAIIESKWGREWIKRLNEIEMGRIHQEAQWIEEGAKYGGREDAQ